MYTKMPLKTDGSPNFLIKQTDENAVFYLKKHLEGYKS
jgi:hypothetical protein